MNKVTTLILAGLVSIGLVACGGAQVVPQDQFYRLAENATVTRLPEPVLKGNVAVAAFSTAAIYHDRAIVYAESARPLELNQHHYHFWIDSPPRLLQDSLERALRSANVAERVVSARASQAAEYQINGILHQFEQSIGASETSVNVAMRLELVEIATGQRLLVKDYAITTPPVMSGNVYAAVESFQQAVNEIFADWVVRLAEL